MNCPYKTCSNCGVDVGTSLIWAVHQTLPPGGESLAMPDYPVTEATKCEFKFPLYSVMNILYSGQIVKIPQKNMVRIEFP